MALGDPFDPLGRPPRTGREIFEAVLGWGIATVLASVVTLALFIGMTKLVSGEFILEKLMRVFPLSQTPVTDEDACAVDGSQLRTIVTIEGTLGTRRSGAFSPLPGAELLGDDRTGKPPRPVEVAGDGSFRFATAFPNEAPSACHPEEPQPAATQRLIVRAPGCEERSVPVTRAWIPHRVLLDCARP